MTASRMGVPPAEPASLPEAVGDARPEVGGPPRWQRWLREPLVQFLAIGLVLFVLDASWNRGAGRSERSHEVVLTGSEALQLQSTFAAQWRRPPSPEEMQSLVENAVRQEILFREALELGLDRDDIIIKRRLAQKMQFLTEDVALSHVPTAEELKVWYRGNGDRFALPSRFAFRHLYFSPDRRGVRVQHDARSALARLARAHEGSSAASGLGDPFMFQDQYADQTPTDLVRDFGPNFAAELSKVPPGSWQGPIESGYGWHLVFVSSVVPGRVPGFEEVEPDVRAAWLADHAGEDHADGRVRPVPAHARIEATSRAVMRPATSAPMKIAVNCLPPSM